MARRFSSVVLVLLFVLAGWASLTPEDVIDMSNPAGRVISFVSQESLRRGVWDLSPVGDVNGDGVSDIGLIHWIRPFQEIVFSYYLIFGSSQRSERNTISFDLPGSSRFWSEEGIPTDSGSLGNVGDLNGDGYAEFAFSSSKYRLPGWSEGFSGVLFIVYGEAGFDYSGEFFDIVSGSIPGTLIYNSSDPSRGKEPGTSGASVADVNGDGEQDLVFDAVPVDSGSSLVHVLLDTRGLGPRVDLKDLGETLPGFTLRVPAVAAVADAGDFDGDGFHDLLISYSDSPTGWVYVFFGRPDPRGVYSLPSLGAVGDGVLRFLPPQRQDDALLFGSSEQVAPVGDLNDDGFDEILIGESYLNYNEPGGPVAHGRVHLIYGGPRLPSPIALDAVPSVRRKVIHGKQTTFYRDSFGLDVASPGDVNGDSIEDLLIGARRASERWEDAGEAYLIYGRAEFPDDLYVDQGFNGIHVLGDNPNGWLGWFLRPGGDFNADGNLDFLVGEPQSTSSGNGARAHVFLGTGNGVPPLNVVSLEPAWGFLRGGTQVRIRGSGFAEGAQVHFAENAARRVEVVSANELLVETPRAPAAIDVAVRVTVGATSRTAATLFSYVPDRPEVDLSQPGRWGLRVDGAVGFEVGRGLDFADIDGDGTHDLLIGSDAAPDWVVTVVRGGRALPETMQAFTPGAGKSLIYKRNQTPRVLRNTRVRNVGDVNGDGITDMAVAAISESSYLFFGRPDLAEELDFEAEVAEGGAVRLLFDHNAQGSFAPLGDVTGDGVDDFVVSIVADKVLFLEGRRAWPEELDLEDEAASFARFVLQVPGFAANIAQVGDVNGDGRPDLLGSGNSASSLKPVYLIYGLDPENLPQEERLEDYLVLGGGVMFEWQGRSATNINPMNVSGVGDVNGDGLADLLIGDEEGGVAFEGITYLIHGRRDFPERVVLPATMEPIEMEGVVRLVGQRQSGRALGPAGDYNGDGYPDFTVGTMDPKIFPPGKIDVVFGSPDLPAVLELGDLRRHGFRLEGVHSTTLLTETARVRGDLNGDGAADFAFSEWRDPAWRPEDGSVHVVFGIPPSVPFIRGDSDGDGRLNITDGVFTLSHLFLGGVNPLCEDATDADDRGTVELTDAVYLLNHLFLGGSEPPAPYPLPGNDPTEDRLGCRGF